MVLIATLLRMYAMVGDMDEYIRQSPAYQRMLEEMKKGFDRETGDANPPALQGIVTSSKRKFTYDQAL